MTTDAPAKNLLPTSRLWTLDMFHSSVRFAVTHHVIATYRAGFGKFSAQYDADTGVLVGSVEVESVQVAFDALYRELMSDVFFSAEMYPQIAFSSTSIRNNGLELEIAGEMTMKGTTRPALARGTVNGTSLVNEYDGTAHRHFGMELDLTIDRRDFKVDHNNTLLDGRVNLGWDVDIHFSLEFSTPAGTVDSNGQFVASLAE